MQLVLPRLLAGSLLVIALDQASKFVLSSYHSVTVVPNLLSITVLNNPGIAFSIPFSGFPLVVLTVGVLVVFAVFFFRSFDSRRGISQAVFSLIIGGGIGNLIDRVLWGTVTDFIAIAFFPVFNLADAAVVIGAGLLLWQYPSIRIPSKNANRTLS